MAASLVRLRVSHGGWTVHGFFASVALSILAGSAMPARAHSGGATELLAQVAVHPRDPGTLVLRYEAGSHGLLYSTDGGASFKMLCASAVDAAANRGTTVGIAGDGHVMLGSFSGVLEDDGQGCGWQPEPSLAGLWVTHLSTHPGDPDVSFAVTSTGTQGSLNALAMRDAQGTWSDLGQREPLLITRLLAAQDAGGLHLYESVEGEPSEVTVDGSPTTIRACSIRVSDDSGGSWESHPCPLSAGKVRIEAIDPADARRILVSAHSETGEDVLWVSDDRGASFSEWMRLSDLGAVAFDGRGQVWIGDWGDAASAAEPRGLLRAASLGAEPEVVADYPVHCLSYDAQSDTLRGCQRFWFGTIDTDTAEFTTTFSLDDVQEFVQCDGVDTAAACEAELCGAYCGPGSFSTAQVCEVYDGPTCGPCAIADSELRPASCDTGAGMQDDAGTAADDHDGVREGGCSVMSPGVPRRQARQTRRSARHQGMLALLLLLGIAMRRRLHTARAAPAGAPVPLRAMGRAMVLASCAVLLLSACGDDEVASDAGSVNDGGSAVEFGAACFTADSGAGVACAQCMCEACPQEVSACDDACWEAVDCARPCTQLASFGDEIACIMQMCPEYVAAYLADPIASFDQCMISQAKDGELRACQQQCELD